MPSSPVVDSVTTRLNAFLSRMRSDGEAYGPDADVFLDDSAATLQGGKRLRARF